MAIGVSKIVQITSSSQSGVVSDPLYRKKLDVSSGRRSDKGTGMANKLDFPVLGSIISSNCSKWRNAMLSLASSCINHLASNVKRKTERQFIHIYTSIMIAKTARPSEYLVASLKLPYLVLKWTICSSAEYLKLFRTESSENIIISDD